MIIGSLCASNLDQKRGIIWYVWYVWYVWYECEELKQCDVNVATHMHVCAFALAQIEFVYTV